jgi:hypothetical protein
MPSRGLLPAGRILIPGVFVGPGLERILVGAGIIAGAPTSAGALVFSVLELLAGLLALCILVDAFLAHAFWTYPTAERHGQLLHFLKNLSTLGGLMLLAGLDAAPTPGMSSKPAGTG